MQTFPDVYSSSSPTRTTAFNVIVRLSSFVSIDGVRPGREHHVSVVMPQVDNGTMRSLDCLCVRFASIKASMFGGKFSLSYPTTVL